jgi:hypothetical protein
MIDISATELDDERPVRMAVLKATYGVGAAPGMNGDHCINGAVSIVSGDGHAMAKRSQNARPTERRNGIAGSCTRTWRSDKNNFHE